MYAAGLVVAAVAVIAIIAKAASDSPAPQPQPQQTIVVVEAPSSYEELSLQRTLTQAVIAARTGHREAVVAIGHQLAQRAPRYYQQSFVDNRQFAACLHPAS